MSSSCKLLLDEVADAIGEGEEKGYNGVGTVKTNISQAVYHLNTLNYFCNATDVYLKKIVFVTLSSATEKHTLTSELMFSKVTWTLC